MGACKIKGCKNRSDRLSASGVKVRLFSFPQKPEYTEKWLEACGQIVDLKKTALVCSIHFLPTYLKNTNGAKHARALFDDAVPTLNLFWKNAVGNYTIDGTPNGNDMALPSAPRSVSAENTSAPIVSPLSSSSSPVFMVKLPSPSPSSVVKNYVKLIEHNNTPSTDASVAIRSQSNATDKTSSLIAALIQENKQLQARLNEQTQVQKNQLQEIRKLKILKKSQIQLSITNILKNCFTQKQIHYLLNPHKKRVKWNKEDIASAVWLKSVSLTAYRYLQKTQPLPSERTLRRWEHLFAKAK